MKWSGYLVVSRVDLPRVLKNKPPATLGEIALPLKLDIPDALFGPPILPTVEITLDANSLPILDVVSEHMDALEGAGIRVQIVNRMSGEADGA